LLIFCITRLILCQAVNTCISEKNQRACVLNLKKIFLDALYRAVAGKPLVLDVLCLEVGTSEASALTAETIFEIMKCIADVDMLPRRRMGSKSENFRFFAP